MKYLLPSWYKVNSQKIVSLIGCGQFGFATISYIILKHQGKLFLECFDIDKERSQFTGNFYGYKSSVNPNTLINNKDCKIVYIASNHFSHTEYAIEAIKAQKDVYIEKPISVNFNQFNNLSAHVRNSNSKIFCGYNRPFSKAIRIIAKKIQNKGQSFSMGCFISGHFIEESHWYRNPQEGTRICGNVGHWIDLMVHLMFKRGNVPKVFEVGIVYSNTAHPDDDLSISISTDVSDIINIMITSRNEPFEGINETINFQDANLIAKIDDFQKITIWEKEKKYSKRFFPKDVGHVLAINQPFLKKKDQRNWKEIEVSTYLMLIIADMVKNTVNFKRISFSEDDQQCSYN
ncbi:Gfo/Idh/MocA family protein [Fulvivirga imtechensis]|nr:Gfo/Idh/MocA family oxidoreductase [Fulvivirga imtechensis]